MTSAVAAPQQYKQPSRKGKKAWRKNVDVSSVQTGLEQARDEVIKGGILSELPSTSLFVTDTAGSSSIRAATRKAQKPLKSDEILAQRSAIPAVHTRRKRSSTEAQSKTTDGVLEPRTKRFKQEDYVSPRERARLYKRAYGGNTVPKDLDISTTPSADPWAEPLLPSENDTEEQNMSFLDKPQPIRAPSTLSRPPVSLLDSAKAASALRKPKEAHSYNPPFEAWDSLLRSEGEKEVLAEQRRLVNAAAEAVEQARIEAAMLEPDGDPLLDDESAWEGFESEYDGVDTEALNKKRPERKTKAERNKIKRRKEEEREKKRKEELKKKEEQARRIEEIAEEVKAKEAREKSTARGPIAATAQNARDSLVATTGDGPDDQSKAGSDSDLSDSNLRRRARLGKRALPPKDLELVLPDELQDSLRLLKPEGNLMRDRFRSLQVRGKLEVRKPIGQVKKRKVIETEKWSYKDWELVA